MKQMNGGNLKNTGGQPPYPRGLSLWGFRKRVMLLEVRANIKKSDARSITLSANLHASAQVAPLRCPIL